MDCGLVRLRTQILRMFLDLRNDSGSCSDKHRGTFETTITFDFLLAKAITEPSHAVISLNLYSINFYQLEGCLDDERQMPILMYGLEACPLKKSDIRSLDFVVDRFFMKLFNTNNIDIIRSCQEHFCFKLPSNLLLARSKKLENCEFVRL